MPKVVHTQTNFTGGEFSPRLVGRSDLSKYAHSSAELSNFITQKHGGIIRRTGSRFVNTTKTQSEASRLIPFQFSVAQTYILEFGDLYIRFYRDKGRLQHGAINTVNDAVNDGTGLIATITFTADHDMEVGDTASIAGILTNYVFDPLRFNGTFIVSDVPNSNQISYVIPLDGTPAGAVYSSGGTAVKVEGNNRDTPTEVATPFLASELRDVKFIQSADILYMVHPLHEPQTLSRNPGADADPAIWVFAAFQTSNGPYLPQNNAPVANVQVINIGNGTSQGDLVGFELSAAAANQINGGRGWLTTDVGRLFALQVLPGNVWQWSRLSVYITARLMHGVLEVSAPAAINTSTWRLGAWSDTTGFPHSVAFHKSRLWFGATNVQPQTLWASRVGDFINFEDFQQEGDSADIGIVLDDHALVFTIDDDKVNTIRWIRSEARGMALLTDGGTFIGAAPRAFDPITPTNFTVLRQLSDGASRTASPHLAGEVTLFIKSASRKVLELVFRFEDDRFVAPDLTILSEHITLSGIVETTYQTEPDNILWCILANGLLIGMTYERSEGVVAWHRHPVGGVLVGQPFPAVESIAVIRDEPDDLLWMIVKRTVNGATVRFIEYVAPPFKDDDASDDAFYVEAGGTFNEPLGILSISTGTSTSITTSVNHFYASGTRVRLRDVAGATELNNRTFLVESPSPDTFTITDLNGGQINSSGFGTYAPATGTSHRESTAISGLLHLVGETVKVLGDGAVQPDQVVDSAGSIVIPTSASIVHVGLAFRSRMKTMPLIPASGSRRGTASDPRASTMRIDHVLLYLNRTIGGVAGSDETLDSIVTRVPSDPAGSATPLFTGIHKLTVSQRSGEQVQIVVQTDDPTPLNLLTIVSKMQVDDI